MMSLPSDAREIPGFVGYYVTPGGEVWSAKRGARRLSAQTNRRGYLQVTLACASGPLTRRIHSLVALAFIGPRPDGMQVNHIDGDRRNNAASNLEYVTGADNLRHAQKAGLVLAGERIGNHRLSETDVFAMRFMSAVGGYPAPVLGCCFDVDTNTAWMAITGRTWANGTRGGARKNRTAKAVSDTTKTEAA